MLSINFKMNKECAEAILKWQDFSFEDEIFIEHEFIFPKEILDMIDFEKKFIKFLMRNNVHKLHFKIIDQDFLRLINNISKNTNVTYENMYSIKEHINNAIKLPK